MGTTETIRQFILTEFLEGEDPNSLTGTTPLISSGVLDSLALLRLVTFLEETFEVTIEPNEADQDHLDNVESIVQLIKSKRG